MPRNPKQYHFIYKTTNTLTDAYYIGMHSTNNLDDGYVGSGLCLQRSINKHGIDNHVCEILEHFTDRKTLSARDAEIVNADLLKDKMWMNIAVGGAGGWKHCNDSLTKEQLLKRAKAGLIAAGWVEFNRKNNKEFQDRLKADPEYRAWWLSRCTPPPSWVGKKHTKATKKKMRQSQLGKHVGEKNSQYGSCWVSSSTESCIKKINKSELQEHIQCGWIRGRKNFSQS